MWVYYSFAALLLLQAVVSLRGGTLYLSYIRRESERAPNAFSPYASVIVPCRGLDQGLRDNLAALFQQDYPSYEIIFVTDSPDDPAVEIIEALRAEHAGNVSSSLCVAGQAVDCGQKVHNLRAAVSQTNVRSEVFAFADSDARPPADWLRSLVAPLADERLGATTGYRWFIPVPGSYASALRAIWNASIASRLGADRTKNFCWGGSTGIRRMTFEQAGILRHWQGAASDDFALTRAMREMQREIHFVPNCLVASNETCNFRELIEFTSRQIKITRVYASHLWRLLLISSLLFVAVFFGGIALVIARALSGGSFITAVGLLLSIYALGSAKAFLRLRAVSIALRSEQTRFSKGMLSHLLLWPVASVLFLYNSLSAAFSRRIDWRGIQYELKSPHETVIIPRV